MSQVMVGRVRLHKLQQQKETKLIIEEVKNLLHGCHISQHYLNMQHPRWRTCSTPMMGCHLCTLTSTCSPLTSTRSRANMRSSTERHSGANISPSLSHNCLLTYIHHAKYQVPWMHRSWQPCQRGAGRPCLPPGSCCPPGRSHLQLRSVQVKGIILIFLKGTQFCYLMIQVDP